MYHQLNLNRFTLTFWYLLPAISSMWIIIKAQSRGNNKQKLADCLRLFVIGSQNHKINFQDARFPFLTLPMEKTLVPKRLKNEYLKHAFDPFLYPRFSCGNVRRDAIHLKNWFLLFWDPIAKILRKPLHFPYSRVY